jgi:ADP-ribose pyrophosphatase YjhB (NUDIX family)
VHRRPLLAILERHLAARPEDLVRVDHIRQFVRQHEDCFLRSCGEGHLTGSALVVSADHSRVVLVHHKKLGCWLQPGGHADGDTDLHDVARREAREETALEELTPIGAPLPLDLDVHRIPPRGDVPAHLHLDLCYLFVAAPGQEPRASDESHAVRWFAHDDVGRLTNEPYLLRLVRRARSRLSD